MQEEELYKFCPVCGGNLKYIDFDNSKLPVCEKCKFQFFLNPYPCATAIIFQEDKILLTKRAHEPGKDTWDLPGGFMKKGETIEAGLKRELKEELNIDLINLKYYGSKVNDTSYLLNGINYNLILSYFCCQFEGTLEPNSEILEWKFFDLRELPEVYFGCHKEILEELTNQLPVV